MPVRGWGGVDHAYAFPQSLSSKRPMGPTRPAHALLATALQSGETASACTPSPFPSRRLLPRALRVLFLRKGAVMDDAQPSRAPLRDALRVLAQEITVLGADPLPPSLLEEIAGVTLLHAAGIVNTVRVPLVVLDATLHVRMANRYFYECFQVTPQETESHRFYDLGNGQWNIPPLRTLLEQIVPHHTVFDDFEVTHTFPHLGPKTMLLNARQILRAYGAPPLILLAIEDI